MNPGQWGARVLFGALGLCLAAQVHAGIWQVQINTAALSGTASTLAFDLIDGGLAANTVMVSGLSVSAGTIDSESSVGDVVGSLLGGGTVTLGDAQFFNEHLATVTLGSSFSFTFNASSHPADPGSFPDSFSFFMLSPGTGLPAFATSDPGGALFAFDINGAPAGPVTVFSVPGNEVQISVTQVPEPGAALLMALGLAGLGGWHLRRRNLAVSG